MNEPSIFSRVSAASLGNVIMDAAPLSVVSQANSRRLIRVLDAKASITHLGGLTKPRDENTEICCGPASQHHGCGHSSAHPRAVAWTVNHAHPTSTTSTATPS